VPRQCIFCTNPADSREHLWPDWVLQTLGHRKPIIRSIEERRLGKAFHGPVKIKCVCTSCNEGWMSTLEGEVRPYLGTMLHGITLTLTARQQETISRWLLKIATVLEGASLRGRSHFYQQTHREELRLNSTIPLGTIAWIGQFAGTGLHVSGEDIWFTIGKDTRAADGCVTTFVVGKVIGQVLTVRFTPEYNRQPIRIHGREGPWNQSLIQIWPTRLSVQWPPALYFPADRGIPSIGDLCYRWRPIS
jgi:hypothetical protein